MPAIPKDWPAVVFTHLAVVACTGVAGWFVHTQGSAAIPQSDEWPLLNEWLAHGRDLGRWAFVPHNEHRYPLAKMLWVGSLEATDFNFRAPMYLTVGLHAAAAVLLLWTARGVRGRAHPADVLFPALTLHLGHSFNLLMGYQVGFAAFVYAAAGWVWAAGRLDRGGRWGWAVLAGVYATVLVQTGGFGLVLTGPLTAWAGYTAAGRWRAGRRAEAAVLALFAALWCGYSAWVWRAMGGLTTAPPADTRTPLALAASAVGYLSCGFGEWPIGPHLARRVTAGGLAVVTCVTGGLVLAWGWWSGRFRGPLPAALAALTAGVLLLAAATGYARGYGMGERFVGPSSLAPVAAALALARFTPPPGWRSAIVGVFGVAAAAALYWVNVEPGLRYGYYTREVCDPFARDITAGLPPVFLAGKYGGTIPVPPADHSTDAIRAYRQAGLGAFRSVAADPEYKLVPVAGVSVPFVYECSSEEFARGPRPVRLPDPPGPVLGLRLRVDCRLPAGWQRLSLHWTDADGKERSAWAYPPWVENRHWMAFPLAGRPTDLRLLPDGVVQPLAVEAAEWMVPK